MADGIFIQQAGNTMAPAFAVMVAKGYAVKSFWSAGEQMCAAERDDNRFVASDPVAVLGLITLAEARGADWLPTDAEVDAFLDEFGS